MNSVSQSFPKSADGFYSEYDEEPFILDFFKHQSRGNFVDIGANNGWKGSNTRALFEKGWSGLCIEADPFTFKHLQETYCDNTDRVQVLNCAVADFDGDAIFYSHNVTDSGLSSLAENYQDSSECTPVVVECHTLDRVFELVGYEDSKIDFLTIDAEGMDFKIISAYSFRQAPSLVMVEIDKSNLDKFDGVFGQNGYHRIWNNIGNAAYERADSGDVEQ